MTRGADVPKSVLLVCDYSLSYMGGAQTAFIRQVGALLSEGWRVTVVAPDAWEVFKDSGSPFLGIIEAKKMLTIPGVGLPIPAKKQQLEARLESFLKEGDVDAIIVHSEFALAALALNLGKKFGIKTISTVHTFFWTAPKWLAPVAPLIELFHEAQTGLKHSSGMIHGSKINTTLRGMTFTAAKESDLVISPSTHQAEELRDAGLERVVTLSNVAQQIKQPVDLPEYPLNIFWAARFAPEKRLQVALDAQKIVTAKLGPGRVNLHVAGGPGSSQDDITFHGKIAGEEISQILSRSHASLITSAGFDNQPMFALEAFAHQKPLITVDPNLKKEFGDAAILSPGRDAASLAGLIMKLYDDREMLSGAALAAKEYAENRTAEFHAKSLGVLI